MIYAALAHLFAVMSPGPDTAIIIREVSLNKRRGGLFCAFGIGVGILIHCYLAIFGISTLLVSNNIAGDLISMFGSFYLIFIGISSFKSESQTSEKSHLISSSFINGFITNIFNIKAFIFFISLFSIILNDDISSIGKSVSFAGFIAVPLILFLQHTLRGSLNLVDKASYSFTLFVWIVSSQIFL